MIKKLLNVSLVALLLVAQVIVATHIHDRSDAVAEQDCVYCQIAAEMAGSDIPETLTVACPVYYAENESVSLFEYVTYFDIFYRYDTRAPPKA